MRNERKKKHKQKVNQSSVELSEREERVSGAEGGREVQTRGRRVHRGTGE